MLVVGAGPAGADLACGLARAGARVVLVDRIRHAGQAAFSSAALPLEALQRYGLPAQVVASRWRGWRLIGPDQQQRHWQHPQPLGAVLDFASLRQWQLEQARLWGAQVRLGCTATATSRDGDGHSTTLRDAAGSCSTVQSRWVVDATGQARALLGDPDEALVTGVGLEWLLQVEPEHWQLWSDQLSFMLGSQWVPQGYGWIFPMQPGVLKVGVCRLLDRGRDQLPLSRLLLQLIGRCDLQQATVLDRHGGLIRSTIGRREAHRRGRLIGLGDAVSTANLLGGEGIRHALASSRVLLPLLLEALARPSRGSRILDRYPGNLKRALGWRWTLSGRLARRTWLSLQDTRADRRLERLLHGLETTGAEQLSALLFEYRFEVYGLRALPYVLGWR